MFDALHSAKQKTSVKKESVKMKKINDVKNEKKATVESEKKATDVESCKNFCLAFSFFDARESDCKVCDNFEIKSLCQYFASLRVAEKTKKVSVSRQVNFLSHNINSQAAKIDEMLLNERLTVKEIAERVATTESRVNSHLYHLKTKRSEQIRILRENSKVFAVMRKSDR